MNLRLLCGAILLVSGLSLALTSYFIIYSPYLTSSFISWIMVGLVLIALSRIPLKTSLNPSTLASIYEEAIDNLIEEFGLHDLKPVYIPSRYSDEPVMVLSLREIPDIKKVPKRLLIFTGNNYMLRIPTLGTLILRDLGGIGSDIASAEDMIRSIVVDYLEIANNVLITEKAGGGELIVRVESPKIRYSRDTNLPSNMYSQIVGVILAEALGKRLRLDKLVIDRRQIEMNFSILGE